MSNKFGAASTTDDILAGLDLNGKRALVTGVSAGLGIETARALAAHGAQVIGAVRDPAKARDALAAAQIEAEASGGSIELIRIDLADLKSVRAAADALIANGRPFDLVVANAGTLMQRLHHTADGFEMQFGTNHLGHFVLVNRIASLIRAGGRLVNLASAGHRLSDVDLGDPNFKHTPYDPMIAYGRTKTANILFAVEFDRRHKHRGVRAAAVHPGGIATELVRDYTEAELQAFQETLEDEGPGPAWKSPAQGAATTIWAGIVADADEIGGRYCEDCGVTTLITDEPLHSMAAGVRPYALDPERAKALWARSEELVDERFPA